jgi:Ni/Fe-hydrogenase subunit HybB-like protein
VNLTFSTTEGKSRRYSGLVAVLAALSITGMVAFGISYYAGHRVFGGSNLIPWGLPIVLAIYLIGLSAGSLILSSLTYVLGREEYKPIARVAVYLAIALIFGAMISIFVDLGRPEKFWRLFGILMTNNMTSMFALNSILYSGYFLITLVYFSFILANKPKTTRILGIVAICWAMLVHMGTGAIFGFIEARETWVSPIRPLEFLSAALTSGVALLILVVVVTTRFTGRFVKKETLISLSRMLVAFIGILLVLITLDKVTHLYGPDRAAAVYLLTGHFAWIFWALQIGMGAVIPFVILLNPKMNKRIGPICFAALSVVVGVFFERYYLVISGAAYPMPYYPGEIQGVWGAVGTFALTPDEMTLGVGIFATVALLFVLGLKYLELLPVSEGQEVDKHA